MKKTASNTIFFVHKSQLKRKSAPHVPFTGRKERKMHRLMVHKFSCAFKVCMYFVFEELEVLFCTQQLNITV